MFYLKGNKMANILQVVAFLLSVYSSLAVAALSLPENYDVSTRPNQGGVPDVVNLSVELLSVRNIDEANSEMTIDISLHTSWVDARLKELVPREKSFFSDIPKIWMPNVQIANSAMSSSLSSLNNQVLQLGEDGFVKLSQKLTPTISCPISLAKYPFDRQICKLHLNSYGYTTVHLALIWNGIVSDNVATYHPEFSFSFTEQISESLKTPSGEYSNLYLDIAVTRCPLRVIFRAMFPSILLLILSYYVTFCHCSLLRNKVTANGNHVEANTVIAQPMAINSFPTGLSSLLVAINGMIFFVIVFVAQINFINSPKSSAVSGLDVWLNVITTIVFVILWHSIQLCFRDYYKSPDVKNQSDSCYVNKATNILKIGIPVVLVVFIIVFFAIYLS